MLPLVSLEHTRNGNNFQRNWTSVEEWKRAMSKDDTIIWSRLFTLAAGIAVASYPMDIEEIQRKENNDRIELLEGLLTHMTHHEGALEETKHRWQPVVSEIVNRCFERSLKV